MAKVTIIIEDIARDGKEFLSISIKSDNEDVNTVTTAESVAATLYESVLALGPNQDMTPIARTKGTALN